MMWSSDSNALPTGLWVSTMTITSLSYINTDVKPQPSHLFFRQDSVNQNTQIQVRTFALFSKFEIEHYLHVCKREIFIKIVFYL